MVKIDSSKVEWDLSPLASGDGDPEFADKRKKIWEANRKFIDKWKSRRDYLEDPKILKEALDELDELESKFGTSGDEGYYFSMRHYLDQRDSKIKAKLNKIEEFSKGLSNDSKFFSLKLGKISEEKQKEFLESDELQEFRHFLEKMFKRGKYILDEEVEKVLSLKSGPCEDHWIRMMEGLLSAENRKVIDEEGKDFEASFSDLANLMNSTKKDVRDRAVEAFNDIIRGLLSVAENEINALLDDKKIEDKLRGFEKADSRRHLNDDIDGEVVDVLINSVSIRNDLTKKYYELKAKLMNVDKLRYHERNVPITFEEGGKKYDYSEGVSFVYDVLNNLDGEFGERFKGFVEGGRIDVFPRNGKRGGACCIHNLKSQPVYTLLNYSGSVNDLATFAHEIGHGIHSELMMENQKSLNIGFPKSSAEVASTFMEDFVFSKLMKEVDSDEKRLELMMEKLNGDLSSIVRQSAFYKFEKDLHKDFREKGYLSKEEIGKLFRKHMVGYMGEFVSQDEGCENWWVYVPHFRSPFYVYSYASGVLISKALQRMVKEDGGKIELVKNFLKSGTSKAPKELFMEMGVDISKKEFWEIGLKEIEEDLNDVWKLAEKLGKI